MSDAQYLNHQTEWSHGHLHHRTEFSVMHLMPLRLKGCFSKLVAALYADNPVIADDAVSVPANTRTRDDCFEGNYCSTNRTIG